MDFVHPVLGLHWALGRGCNGPLAAGSELAEDASPDRTVERIRNFGDTVHLIEQSREEGKRAARAHRDPTVGNVGCASTVWSALFFVVVCLLFHSIPTH